MRIYIVKTNAEASMVRYVRAANQAAAIRAVVAERFSAVAATADDIYAASRAGSFEVLDAAPSVDDGPASIEPAPVDADELPGGRNYPRQIA